MAIQVSNNRAHHDNVAEASRMGHKNLREVENVESAVTEIGLCGHLYALRLMRSKGRCEGKTH